jgi:hypothetical protein
VATADTRLLRPQTAGRCGWIAAAVVSLAALGRADEPAPLDVAPVWSGHPVGFALLTAGDRQLVGFYDADRRLTVAVRSLGERTWTFVPLPRTTGWDSHNSVALAVDRDGFVHLAADMHSSPLVYFRSRHPLAEPFTAESFEPVHRMTGDREDRVTYPVFLHDAAGELVFMHRHGSSGDGDQIINRYDAATRSWRRLIDAPLTGGRRDGDTMNAYFEGPIRGPDGLFHLAWVWRDTPDCDTCHDVCYARSRDLVHWERSDGTPLDLPITADTCEVVDPVPPGQGLINGLVRIGFDARHRPVLSYHAYDEACRRWRRVAVPRHGGASGVRHGNTRRRPALHAPLGDARPQPRPAPPRALARSEYAAGHRGGPLSPPPPGDDACAPWSTGSSSGSCRATRSPGAPISSPASDSRPSRSPSRPS